MNEIQYYSYMSIPVAEQKSSRREPVRLESGGAGLRRLFKQASETLTMMEKSFSWLTKETTYCNYNPAECRGVA